MYRYDSEQSYLILQGSESKFYSDQKVVWLLEPNDQISMKTNRDTQDRGNAKAQNEIHRRHKAQHAVS